MLGRVFAIAMNTYREAVRARVLFGLLAASAAARRPKSTRARTASLYVFIAMAKTLPSIG